MTQYSNVKCRLEFYVFMSYRCVCVCGLLFSFTLKTRTRMRMRIEGYKNMLLFSHAFLSADNGDVINVWWHLFLSSFIRDNLRAYIVACRLNGWWLKYLLAAWKVFFIWIIVWEVGYFNQLFKIAILAKGRERWENS